MEGKLVSKASQPFPAHTKVVYIMGPRPLVINLLSTKASASCSHCTYTHFLPQDSALSDPYHTSLAREHYPLTFGFGARLRLACSGSVFFTPVIQTPFLLQKKAGHPSCLYPPQQQPIQSNMMSLSPTKSLSKNRIRTSTSMYAAPVLLARKPTGPSA